MWAEPNINHAAKLMKKIFSDRNLSLRIGEKASEYIKRNYSVSAVAKIISNRVKIIMGKSRY